MKGKQVKISTDSELVIMYETHKKKKRILLWMKCKSKATPPKRVLECDKSDLPQNKRQASLLTMMNEVDTIVTKLTDIHGKKFTPVQLNCWAHMINTHKHDSFDIPPNKPFFGKKSDGDTVGISPTKKISLRSECINQLDKWHQLKERGVIGNDQYEELQAKILGDIKKF